MSALAILDALGLVEHAMLEFPVKIQDYDRDRDVVLFPARTRDGDIDCAISGKALEDHFGAKGISRRSRLAAFRAHRQDIEDSARQQYVSHRLELDGSILIRSIET